MTTPVRQPKPSGSRWAWHLLWVLPIVLFAHFVALFWITLAWCGVSGCTGSGFGRISDPSLGLVLFGGLVVALVWCAAIGGLPWHPSPRRRLVAGAVAGIGIAVLTMLAGTSFFIR